MNEVRTKIPILYPLPSPDHDIDPIARAAWEAFLLKYWGTVPDPTRLDRCPDVLPAFEERLKRERSEQRRLAASLGSPDLGHESRADAPAWHLVLVSEMVFLPTVGSLTPVQDYRPAECDGADPWQPIAPHDLENLRQILKQARAEAGRYGVLGFLKQPSESASEILMPDTLALVQWRTARLIRRIPAES